MTHTTDKERAEFEEAFIAEKLRLIDDGDSESGAQAIRAFHLVMRHGEYTSLEAKFAWWAWQAARRAQVVQPLDPVEGDQLPPIGSRVFIRHGRDDDAHACIVTGYYVWGDLKGDKRLHRVFVRMVYEGTQTQNARMLCDCYKTEAEALAAAPQPTEADMGIPISQTNQQVEAPVQLPEPVAYLHECGKKPSLRTLEFSKVAIQLSAKGYKSLPLYTEQQVRQLFAAWRDCAALRDQLEVSQAQRVPLSDEAMWKILDKTHNLPEFDSYELDALFQAGRNVEAACIGITQEKQG